MEPTLYGESIGPPGSDVWSKAKMHVLDLSLWYQKPSTFRKATEEQALSRVSLPIFAQKVTGIMGPSGCGKSTLLKALNRLHDLRPGRRIEGKILLDGEDIFSRGRDVNLVRSHVGIVLQEPTPFPMSIYENIAFGIRLYEKLSKEELDARVEAALVSAALWSEVKDRLHSDGRSLSGGQQQRLCLARSVAVKPEVILMDEPTSKLDPDSAELIEELIEVLKKQYTIVIVTHDGFQAARVSDFVAFMYKGALVEFDTVNNIASQPRSKLADRYIRGRLLGNGKKKD